MNPTHCRRKGFTLVELLVVIAIIGILVALLLPAVQAAREASRRMSCSNNLKQIGIALHGYHDTYNTFPSASVTGDPSRNIEESWGWHVFILPFMEQQPLWEQLTVNGRTLESVLQNGVNGSQAEAERLLQTVIEGYHCPTDQRFDVVPVELRQFRGRGNNAGGRIEVGKSNYAAVCGFYDKPIITPGTENNGVFFNNSRIRIADIRDGTSNTFAVGERDIRCGVASWPGTRNAPGPCHCGIYHNRGRVSTKLNADFYTPSPKGQTSQCKCTGCSEGFSSLHAGGAMFVMCDGAVRFINENIAFNNVISNVTNLNTKPNPTQLGVYQLLGIRNDGEPINDDF